MQMSSVEDEEEVRKKQGEQMESCCTGECWGVGWVETIEMA